MSGDWKPRTDGLFVEYEQAHRDAGYHELAKELDALYAEYDETLDDDLIVRIDELNNILGGL